MKVKEESAKVGLKLNIQTMKIMEPGHITSWQIDGETVTDCFSWALKSLQIVTAVCASFSLAFRMMYSA